MFNYTHSHVKPKGSEQDNDNYSFGCYFVGNTAYCAYYP